jgi:glycosyltransferase involved in cell wall biosynthesis
VNLDKVLRKANRKYEILCIVDGSPDRTEKEARRFLIINPKLKIYSYRKNRGKGYAVRYGFSKARGQLLGFIDAGTEINPQDLLTLMKIQKEEGVDVVVGSKRHPLSKINYPPLRKLLSLGYFIINKFLFGLPVRDTQFGMKLYRRNVFRRIKRYLSVNGFAFDIEMLSLANHFRYKIVESPIRLISKRESFSTITFKGGFIRNSLIVFRETIKIYQRLRKMKK